MATRAVSVPLRWPAMRGKWRRCAQRPLPSMITARCFGNWPRFNFSSRNASSAVTAPSGWEDATWRVFGEEGSVTGLGGALLYRIKLTRHSGGLQRVIGLVSEMTTRQCALREPDDQRFRESMNRQQRSSG